ncbi:hypothetical protein ACVILK_003160 [Bradyrhizobium embrapense]
MRQSEEQVEIDTAYSMLAKAFDGQSDLRFALETVDRPLNYGIEALHADARAADGRCSQGFRHLGRERAGVDLDGERGRFAERETAAQQLHQSQEIDRWDGSRRAAAEMQVAHWKTVRRLLCDQTNFLSYRQQVIANRPLAVSEACWEAAIPADRTAERNVKVERYGFVRRQPAQPRLIGRGADRIREIRYGWVDGVPGQASIAIFV